VYVPNSESGTVDVIDPRAETNDLGNSLTRIDPKTGKPGAPIPVDDPYNMYFSSDGRDATHLYATNRAEGSISLISFRTRRQVAKWRIPGGGSPDMGGVSADGKVLWLSGRYTGVVSAISTRNGQQLAKIPVGAGPQGLCVWPQPGRYSLEHTGILSGRVEALEAVLSRRRAG
jgi:DNA-binding beta-propeller fold protein YncE